MTPQLENGHTDLANELIDQFQRLHLSGNEWQIIWVVIRQTWGWHKKEDGISLTQFQEKTELSRPSVSEAVSKLVGKKVLSVSKESYINKYSVNKLYSEWVVPKKVLVGFSVSTSREKGTTLVGKKVLKLVPKKVHTKTNKTTNTKTTIQKKGKYSQIENILEEDILEIADKYKVPDTFVQSKLDDLINWHEKKPHKNYYSNYKRALMDWVKRDALKIISKQQERNPRQGTTHV